MHLMPRAGEPCAIQPDDHAGPCRTEQGLANYRDSQARYMNANPVARALSIIRYEAKQRGQR